MNNQPKKPKMQGKHASHRNAIIRTLVLELIRNERLKSTPSKVKILKQRFDRLVTQAKQEDRASRMRVANFLRNDKAETKLYNVLLPRLAEDNSGFTLTAHTLPRKGDNAAQMIIMVKGAEVKQRKSRLQKALDKKDDKPADKKAEAKPAKRATKKDAVKQTQKKESTKNIRRNSK